MSDATTTKRGPRRSDEQILADLEAQKARIEGNRKVEAWASLQYDRLLSLEGSTEKGLRALGKLLLTK